MQVKVTVEFVGTKEEVLAQMQKFTHGAEPQTEVATVSAPSVGEELPEAPAKRPRKPKAEKEAEAETFDLGGEETEEAEAPKYTKKDVITALKNCSTKKGRDAAIAILSGLKVKSVDEIKESDYAKVIQLAG